MKCAASSCLEIEVALKSIKFTATKSLLGIIPSRRNWFQQLHLHFAVNNLQTSVKTSLKYSICLRQLATSFRSGANDELKRMKFGGNSSCSFGRLVLSFPLTCGRMVRLRHHNILNQHRLKTLQRALQPRHQDSLCPTAISANCFSLFLENCLKRAAH